MQLSRTKQQDITFSMAKEKLQDLGASLK